MSDYYRILKSIVTKNNGWKVIFLPWFIVPKSKNEPGSMLRYYQTFLNFDELAFFVYWLIPLPMIGRRHFRSY